LLWLVVLGRLELSIAYPMLSLGYVVVMLVARTLFQEVIPVRRWLGTFLIMLGISVLVGGVL
jgi:undecaprenyl phosphate-alpha-L-ara4N flippase subunit ArnE